MISNTNVISIDEYTNDSLRNLMRKYKNIHDRIKDDLTELECLKIAISSQVKENQSNAFYENITATYRESYIRVNWDGKKLDGYLITHPELSVFRKEISVKASAALKIR